MNDTTPNPPNAPPPAWRTKEFLLSDLSWLDYVKGVYSIDPGDYPFVTYIGLNFTREGIKNYKFYFSFFRRLTEEELQIVLPVSNRSHFDELYAQWKPSRVYDIMHRGTTFALKVDGSGKLTHYYHLRLPCMPFGPPQRLTLSPEDVNNEHGVCEEFTGTDIQLKRYYYCNNKETIAGTLVEAGLQDMTEYLPSIDSLEYIESDRRDKLEWITSHRGIIDTLVERRGSPRLVLALANICFDCGFVVYGPGSARDVKDHALYFIMPNEELHPGGIMFDGVQQFMTEHLKLDRIRP